MRPKGASLVLLLFFFAGAFPLFSQQDGEEVAIGTYHVIHSRVLKEDRTLLIHLPRGYEDGKRRYPVIYMLYGDHVTTYFAEAVSVLDTLGPTGRIPDCLLVGVMNTDRYRDLLPLAPDGKPTGIENFTRFLRSEAIPFVETHYRTQDFRILVGPQAGANFGLFTLFRHPDLFGALIINHPFRWQGGRDLILKTGEEFFNQKRDFKKFVFITYDDTDALAREGIGFLDRFSKLVDANRPRGFELALDFLPGHDEFLQRLGLREGLKRLFAGYPFPEKRKVEGLDDVLSFYRELSAQYGFAVDPPEHVLTVQGDRLLELGQLHEVVKILEFAMERYPRGANSYFRMANLLSRKGDLEGARDYMRKAVELVPHDNGMLRSRLTGLEKRIAASAAYQVEKAIRSGGGEAGIGAFRELQAHPRPPLYFDEKEFNDLGYRLMQAGDPAGALQVFRMNVELHPESANAHDSLGECCMKTGQKEQAIASYGRSLEIDPRNQNAREMLSKLQEANPVWKGPYLGQTPPGMTPELFAPGIVSKEGHQARLSFAPNGLEAIYEERGPDSNRNHFVSMRSDRGVWLERTIIPFSTEHINNEPCLSPDGKKVFFVSNRPASPGGEAGKTPDIWVSERVESGWGEPQKLGPAVNSPDIEVQPYLGPDGTLYFMRQGGGGRQLLCASFREGKLLDAVPLNGEIVPDQVSGPCIFPNQRVLILHSRMEGGFGNWDLYASFRDASGYWGRPVNLGASVNTAGSEGNATLSPDGRFLFFTRDGDIYWVSAGIIDTLRPRE